MGTCPGRGRDWAQIINLKMWIMCNEMKVGALPTKEERENAWAIQELRNLADLLSGMEITLQGRFQIEMGTGFWDAEITAHDDTVSFLFSHPVSYRKNVRITHKSMARGFTCKYVPGGEIWRDAVVSVFCANWGTKREDVTFAEFYE